MRLTPTAETPVSPAREDPVVAAASNIVGGPPGDHAQLVDRRTWWTPVRVLVALAIFTCILGYVQKSPCRDTRNWSEEFQYTWMCYSDVVALFGQEGLAEGKRPYLDYPTEYPPAIGGVMFLAASVAGLWPSSQPVYRTENGQQVLDHYSFDARTAAFYDVTFILFLIAAVVAVACTAFTAGRRRVWDAALFALAPALVLHLMTNWDIVAVALAAAGMLAWARRRPVLAGVLLGLGVVTKLYPLFFLAGLAVLCARSGRLREFGQTAAATIATAVAVVAPLWLSAGYFDGEERVGDSIASTFFGGGDWLALVTGGSEHARNAVARFYDLNSERPADWDSLAFAITWLSGAYEPGAFQGPHVTIMILSAVLLGAAGYAAARSWPRRRTAAAAAPALCWLAVALLTPYVLTSIREGGISQRQLNVSTAVAFGLALLTIAALCLVAPRRPRLPQVLFLIVAAFLLTNKVFSPQYTVWLLPLAALARPRWRMFLLWQLTEAGVLLTRFLHFVYNDTDGADGVNRGWFVGAVAIRDLALFVLAALVVREILRPELDVVRASGVDDPAGGVLDGAPDVSLRHYRTRWRGGGGQAGADVGGGAPAGEPDADRDADRDADPDADPDADRESMPAAAPAAAALVGGDGNAAAAGATGKPATPVEPPGSVFQPRRPAQPSGPAESRGHGVDDGVDG